MFIILLKVMLYSCTKVTTRLTVVGTPAFFLQGIGRVQTADLQIFLFIITHFVKGQHLLTIKVK